VEQRNKVRGVDTDRNVAQLTFVSVPDRPGVARSVFAPFAAAGVSVDVIVQNVGHDGTTDLSFTVARSDLARARRLLEPLVGEIGAREVTVDDSVAKVSIVGVGVLDAPGYASRMFGALADEGINIALISTSQIRITCLIEEAQLERAAQALRHAFELEVPEPAVPVPRSRRGPKGEPL
jgi:aspartate kinase